ncbi:hypothetical protein WB403_51640, partial [Streptomyces brasiliscabiei]
RKIVDFLTTNVVEQLSSGDMFFFSGISLAVLEQDARELFWQKVTQLKQAGVKIVFDPNYRARLWHSIDETKQQYDSAFAA